MSEHLFAGRAKAGGFAKLTGKNAACSHARSLRKSRPTGDSNAPAPENSGQLLLKRQRRRSFVAVRITRCRHSRSMRVFGIAARRRGASNRGGGGRKRDDPGAYEGRLQERRGSMRDAEISGGRQRVETQRNTTNETRKVGGWGCGGRDAVRPSGSCMFHSSRSKRGSTAHKLQGSSRQTEQVR